MPAGDRPSPDAFPDVERVLHMLNAVRAQVLSGQPLLPAAISERLGQSDIGSFEFGPGLLSTGCARGTHRRADRVCAARSWALGSA